MAGIKISKDSISNIYLFYGEENYKKKLYRDQLIKLIAGPGNINYSAFEGKNIDFSAVYDNAVTLPFFADKRLVIVENSGKFKAKKAKSDDGGDGADASSGSDKMLEKLLNDLPATTCLVFLEDEAAKNKKIFKTIQSKGTVCECAADTPDAVAKWLAKGFAGSGKQIRLSTAMLIIDRAGTDYSQLRNEFEKILGYVGDRSEITDADVIAVTAESIESKIFDMLDNLCSGNVKGLLEKYYGLLSNREPALYILSMIRMQYRTILQVSELNAMGRSKYEIVDILKKHKFTVEKSLGFSRYYSVKELENILDEISETDFRIKNGQVDEQLGVETMLLSIAKRTI